MILAYAPASWMLTVLMLRSTARLKAWWLNSNSPADSCRRRSSSVFMEGNGKTIVKAFIQRKLKRGGKKEVECPIASDETAENLASAGCRTAKLNRYSCAMHDSRCDPKSRGADRPRGQA